MHCKINLYQQHLATRTHIHNFLVSFCLDDYIKAFNQHEKVQQIKNEMVLSGIKNLEIEKNKYISCEDCGTWDIGKGKFQVCGHDNKKE